jgi:DNA-binding transcriptional LysR family regulator
MRTVCILPADHPLSTADEVWPEDLAGERMIHTRRDSQFFRTLEEQFITRGVALPSLIEVRQFNAACMLVAEGAGVSVVSDLDARAYEGRGLTIKPFRPQVNHNLTLLQPIHTRISMITLEFIEVFKASLEPYLAE